MTPLFDLDRVCCAFGDRPALREVSLRVDPGESLALLGPNGSGKSTLLRLLTGLHPPESGTYRYEGREVSPRALKDGAFARRLRQRVGFLFQHPVDQLFCSSVEEEILFGPLQMGLPEGEALRRLEDCLRLLDLGDLRRRAPYALSGGEQKRVALAAVLACNPGTLLLDEPFGELDPRSRRALRDLLARLGRAGKTLVAATHDLSFGEGLFHRGVVFREDHRVGADAPLETILADTKRLEDWNLL